MTTVASTAAGLFDCGPAAGSGVGGFATGSPVPGAAAGSFVCDIYLSTIISTATPPGFHRFRSRAAKPVDGASGTEPPAPRRAALVGLHDPVFSDAYFYYG